MSTVRGSLSVDWVDDKAVSDCENCRRPFSLTRRRHHCRYCGHLFCHECSDQKCRLPPEYGFNDPQRVCGKCRDHLESPNQVFSEDAEVLIAQTFLRDSRFQMLKGANVLLMGSRHPPNKSYFLVDDERKNSVVMAFLERPATCVFKLHKDAEKQCLSAILQILRHPYILPTLHADYLVAQDRVVVFRPAIAKGSLKDLIYDADWKKPYTTKYLQRASKRQPLPEKLIAFYGRQILEGLDFLDKKGIPYSNLHSGNVMYDKKADKCMLTDYENDLLGLPALYAPLMPSWVCNKPVLCFGRLLHEMATGIEIEGPTLPADANLPCASSVSQIIQTIFRPESAELTIRHLLDLPFFAGQKLRETNVDDPSVRLDSDAKKILKRLKKQNSEMQSVAADVGDFDRAASDETPTKSPDSKKKKSKRKESRAEASPAPASTATPNPPAPPPQPPAPAQTPQPQAGRAGLLGDIQRLRIPSEG